MTSCWVCINQKEIRISRISIYRKSINYDGRRQGLPKTNSDNSHGKIRMEARFDTKLVLQKMKQIFQVNKDNILKMLWFMKESKGSTLPISKRNKWSQKHSGPRRWKEKNKHISKEILKIRIYLLAGGVECWLVLPVVMDIQQHFIFPNAIKWLAPFGGSDGCKHILVIHFLVPVIIKGLFPIDPW